jgi:hypothetical protein
VFWIALLQAVVVFTPSPLSKNVGNWEVRSTILKKKLL